jgi:hypothetical protein
MSLLARPANRIVNLRGAEENCGFRGGAGRAISPDRKLNLIR